MRIGRNSPPDPAAPARGGSSVWGAIRGWFERQSSHRHWESYHENVDGALPADYRPPACQGRYPYVWDPAAAARAVKDFLGDRSSCPMDEFLATGGPAADALKADPNLLRCLDVGRQKWLDQKFSKADMEAILADEAALPGPALPDVARLLHKNFAKLDRGEKGQITLDDLRAAEKNAALPRALRDLCTLVLHNRSYFNTIDSSRLRDAGLAKRELEEVLWAPNPEKAQRWTPECDRNLERALNGEARLDNLFTAFRQTNRGNCVTTATLKAAMDRFQNHVFYEVRRNEGGGYDVKMFDGCQVDLTGAEMEQAALSTRYRGASPEAMAYATLAYAAVGKRALREHLDGAKTLGEAFLALNHGQFNDRPARLLGLGHHQHNLFWKSSYPKHRAVVAASGHHSVYVSQQNGVAYTDHYGHRTRYNGTDTTDEKGKLNTAFYFD